MHALLCICCHISVCSIIPEADPHPATLSLPFSIQGIYCLPGPYFLNKCSIILSDSNIFSPVLGSSCNVQQFEVQFKLSAYIVIVAAAICSACSTCCCYLKTECICNYMCTYRTCSHSMILFFLNKALHYARDSAADDSIARVQ
jgi:hypothetical protein